MQTCTVPEVAAELDRTEHHVYVLVREGHLRSIKEKRRYPNKLTRGYSVVEARVITRSSLDEYKRQYTPDAVPQGRISHAKAEAKYPDFGKSLNSWHAPTRRHTKSKNKITRRKCPIGRPLTVERYRVADSKGVLRFRIHYLVAELESIQELLRKGIGCITENDDLYKTVARLAIDYRCTVAMVHRVLKRFPKSKRPRPIHREVLVRMGHGGLYLKMQQLWPDNWFQKVFKVRARRSPATLIRNRKVYVSRKKAAQISGCTQATLFWWYQQEHCVWLNRALDVWEEPDASRKGLRGPKATLYIAQADAELLALKRRAAVKLGSSGKGKRPAILKAIVGMSPCRESTKGEESHMIETDHEADNAAYRTSLPALIASAGKVVASLDSLPKEGEVTAHPRETGRRFNVAVTKAADFFRFLHKVRAPAMGTSFMAVSEGLRTVFEKTYGVRFVNKETKTAKFGWTFNVLALPRDADQLSSGEEAQPEADAKETYRKMLAGEIELPALNRGLLDTLTREIAKMSAIALPQGPEALCARKVSSLGAMADDHAGPPMQTSAPDKSVSAAVSANNSLKFVGTRPTAQIQKLALAILNRGAKSEQQIGREICGDKADSALSQYRRLKRNGRIVTENR